MDADRMEEWIGTLEPDEIEDAYFLARVIADQDDLSPATLDECRWRILARQRFLWLDGSTIYD